MTDSQKSSHFHATRWSLVARLQSPGEEVENTERMQALEELCRIYWTPLFVFARRQGLPPHDAEDAVQGFFVRALGKELFEAATPERGRLRSYLLTALKRYLINERRARDAAKRGGLEIHLSVHADTGERSGAWQITSLETPEQAYDHRWACALLEHCMGLLKAEYEERGHGDVFDAVPPLLTPGTGATIQSAAQALNMREGTVRVALTRMRRRFGLLVQDEVKATLLPGDDFNDEIQHLMNALSTGSRGGAAEAAVSRS